MNTDIAWERILFTCAVVGLFLPSLVLPSQGQPNSPQDQATFDPGALHISALVQTNGTLSMLPDLEGAIDITGWTMTTGKEGQPMFVPEAGSKGAPAEANLAPLSGNEGWDGSFGIAGYPPNCAALSAFGGLVYVSGFSDSTDRSDIACWDGQKWFNLGTAYGGTTIIYSLLAQQGRLWVGGIFNEVAGVPAKSVAMWDGIRWRSAGSGIPGIVSTLTWKNGDLYAGGSFLQAGGATATNIARWDGTNWHAFGSGLGISNFFTLAVNSIAFRDGELHAGGSFTNSGSTPLNRLAKWNGTAWEDVGGGVSGPGASVAALAETNGLLYVGGRFNTAGGISANNIAQWNGSAWASMGSGANSNVSFLALSTNEELFACGAFTNIGGIPASRIAKWNGSWSPLANGVSASSTRLSIDGTNLYIGGTFLYAYQTNEAIVADDVACWDGTRWKALGEPGRFNGAADTVRSLVLTNGNLYVGGDFLSIGNIPANRIARWDGTNWHSYGGGLNGSVRAMAVVGGSVYAGGVFSDADGVPVSNLAMWNGSVWEDVGGGVDGAVNSLLWDGTGLYVGGAFTNAGGSPVFGLGFWDGENWSAVGSGLSGSSINCATMLKDGGNLIIGGRFVVSGLGFSTNIASWSGTSWSGFGGGANNDVLCLAKINGSLYAGGLFTRISTLTANRIARWNGASWSTLGSGASSGSIRTIVEANGAVLACGSFTTIGGGSIRAVASWNGSIWSGLGSGFTTPATSFAMATDSVNVFVGGVSTSAGNKPARNLARWNPQVNFDPPANLAVSPLALEEDGFPTFRLDAVSVTNFTIRYSTNMMDWVSFKTNSVTPFFFFATNPPVSPGVFYQVVSGP